MVRVIDGRKKANRGAQCVVSKCREETNYDAGWDRWTTTAKDEQRAETPKVAPQNVAPKPRIRYTNSRKRRKRSRSTMEDTPTGDKIQAEESPPVLHLDFSESNNNDNSKSTFSSPTSREYMARAHRGEEKRFQLTGAMAGIQSPHEISIIADCEQPTLSTGNQPGGNVAGSTLPAARPRATFLVSDLQDSVGVQQGKYSAIESSTKNVEHVEGRVVDCANQNSKGRSFDSQFHRGTQSSLERELQQARIELKHMTASWKSAHNAVDEKERELMKEKTRNADLEKEFQKVKVKNEELENRLEKMDESLSLQLKANKKCHEAEIAQLRTKHEEHCQEIIKRLKEQAEEEMSEHTHLLESKHEEKIQKLHREYQKKTAKATQQAFDEASEEIRDEMSSEFSTLEKIWRGQLKDSKSKLDAALSEMIDMEKDLNISKESEKQFREELKLVIEGNDKLSDKLRRYTIEHRMLKSKCKQLEKDLKGKNEQLSKVSSELFECANQKQMLIDRQKSIEEKEAFLKTQELEIHERAMKIRKYEDLWKARAKKATRSTEPVGALVGASTEEQSPVATPEAESSRPTYKRTSLVPTTKKSPPITRRSPRRAKHRTSLHAIAAKTNQRVGKSITPGRSITRQSVTSYWLR